MTEPRKTALTKPPKTKRKPSTAVTLVVRPDGTFAPSTEASRMACRAKKLYSGVEVIAYLYQVRSLDNWHKAHGLGAALVEHVADFENLTPHDALKKLQEDGEIACDVERVEIKGYGHLKRIVPHSLAFDEMDESEFQNVYGRMVEYVRQKYWPTLDEAGMQGLQRLLGMGS